jgi:LAO/AO transport system kinase
MDKLCSSLDQSNFSPLPPLGYQIRCMRADQRSIDSFIDGVLQRDRVILGQAITLIESKQAADQQKAAKLMAALNGRSGQKYALRIGISGSPGVGKSTFIEALGMQLVKQGYRVAVLAVDPSSALSGGSILGDKTRMERLSLEKNAFIRPSAAQDTLGGVARKTRESIQVIEAAGYDIILVETVGVGQSEVAVQSMTDLFVLMLLPGAGDELQGIKRGIVEMADLCIINKADGERMTLAKTAAAHYRNALHLLLQKPHGQEVEVIMTSALDGLGIDLFVAKLFELQTAHQQSGYFDQKRSEQAIYWWKETIAQLLEQSFDQTVGMQAFLKDQRGMVLQGEVSPFAAAEAAVQYYLNQRGNGE